MTMLVLEVGAGVAAWVIVLLFAVGATRAAAKPWPEREDRFRDE